MLIIDAFNVLHAAAALSQPFGRMSITDLASLIASAPPPPGVSGTGSGYRVLLVCDGTAGGLARSDPAQIYGQYGMIVQYMFAGSGKDADSVIENVLEEQHRISASKGCMVVSTDRRVQAAARAVRAKVLPAKEFLVLLGKAISPGGRISDEKDQRPAFAQATPLDPGSTQWWMKFFGFAAETGTFPPRPPERETFASKVETRVQKSSPSNRQSRSKQTESDVRGIEEGATLPPRLSTGSLPSGPEALARALQTWAQGLKLDDLDMAQWLSDDFQPPARPHDELDHPSGHGRARKKRGR